MTLRGIEVAEEILGLIVDLEDEEIQEAIDAISKAEGTYGILWGLDNIQRSGMDLHYYNMKKKVLVFAQRLRDSNVWPMAILAEAHRKIDQEKGRALAE